jgi:arylsulfatase A-like enzyme
MTPSTTSASATSSDTPSGTRSARRPIVGRTTKESTPAWPDPVLPPAGSPNVVVILLDDTGFSHLSCFGSVIETPNFDRLAAGGLRYTNFHTTALCSPTRACLLTGRNHHSVGMRALSNFDDGFENMRGRIAASAATIAEVLQPRGYSTFAVGKWHLAPMREASAAGPFGDWPLGRGFDRYYGFHQGEMDQFHPELYQDNAMTDPPRTPAEGYILTDDLVDRSLQMIRNKHSLVPERPFFLYLALGAMHAPHQAPDEYLQKYRGRFDEGWDVIRKRVYERQLEMGIIPPGTQLAPRNRGVKPWDELTVDEQRLACRLQEAFAAMLDHTDAQIGRVLDDLDRLGLADNTLIFALSDNGASQEGFATGVCDTFQYFNGVQPSVADGIARLDDIGTRRSNNNYPWGWAQVGNTPSKRYKQDTHGGGVRDPLIVRWPAGIDASVVGGIRRQFHHVIDLAPTIYDALGIDAPASVKGVAQQAIEGVSLRYSFAPEAVDSVAVPTMKKSQYFEMRGHRAIWSDGWKAVSYHLPGTTLDDDVWELYHLDEDFSECNDLAEAEPPRLRRMVDLFWIEAGRYGVLPIEEDRSNLFSGHQTPGTPASRHTFTYYPPIDRIPPDGAPALGTRTWTMTFDLERSATDAGVLLSYGTINNGLVVYVDVDGHLVYDHNAFTLHSVARSASPVPAGDVRVEVKQHRVKGGPAKAELYVAGELVGEQIIPFVPAMISPVGIDVGRNLSGVSDAYEPPFTFTGRITRIVIDTKPSMSPKDEFAIALVAALATQ